MPARAQRQQEAARVVEDLQRMQQRIQHIDVAVAIDRHALLAGRIAGGIALAPEAADEPAVRIEHLQDSPAALKAYAGKFGAGPQWQMLTGTVADSIAVQRAFDVYRGDKMNHQPATFLRARQGQPWVRLDGFASAADILSEYHKLRAR